MEATPDSPMDSQCPALQQNRLSRGTKEFNPRIADIEELPPSPKKPVVTMEDLKNFEPPSYRASESPQTLPQDWFSINAEQAGELGLRPPNSKLMKRIMLFTPAYVFNGLGCEANAY